MHREGIDPDNVKPEDVLCDFCRKSAWASNEPCVEGHQGSIICGKCLTAAYSELVFGNAQSETTDSCVMCLEQREESVWQGAVDPVATICLRCAKQSAAILTKSKHWEWSKPTPQ